MWEGQGGGEEGEAEVALLADERCSPAVLDFSRSTHVGRMALPVDEIGTVRGRRRTRRKRTKWRSKRTSDPRASGIGFHL